MRAQLKARVAMMPAENCEERKPLVSFIIDFFSSGQTIAHNTLAESATSTTRSMISFQVVNKRDNNAISI